MSVPSRPKGLRPRCGLLPASAAAAVVVLPESAFLSHRRKNSETRHRGQGGKVRIHQVARHSQGQRGQTRRAAVLSFFGKPVIWGVKRNGWNIYWR